MYTTNKTIKVPGRNWFFWWVWDFLENMALEQSLKDEEDFSTFSFENVVPGEEKSLQAEVKA